MKRLLCIMLVIALVLCAVPVVGGVAGNGIIFLAVNDSIPITLSADTMPFYSGGTLYVPYTLFDVTALGVTASYNVLNMTLTLSDSSRRIVFDLENGTSADSSNSGASWSTISKSSIVFVPAEYCAGFFGIGVSMLTSLGGYSVVRFTTGDQVYDDSYFIEKADSLIETRAAQYFNNTASLSPSPQVTVSASASPSASASATPSATVTSEPSAQTPTSEEETPDASDEPEEPDETEGPEEEEEAEPQDVYLVYYNAEGMEAMAETLEAQGMTGAFFLTQEELSAHPTLLSRLFAGGHAVGLLLESDADVAAQLAAANETADQQTKRPLLWVYAREGGEEAADLGYLVLSAEDTEGLVYEIDSTQGTAALEYFAQNNYIVQTLRMTTVLGIS